MNKLLILTVLIHLVSITSGFKLKGLDFTARVDATGCPSQAQVNQEISIIDAAAESVRIYSLVDCNQGAMVLEAIKELNLGLRVALGIWLDIYYAAEFPNEYAALISLASSYSLSNVDYFIVGSETQYRGDFSADLLISYIQNISTTLKSQLGYTNIKVTTADVVQSLIGEPQIISVVDVVAYNQFAFWENVPIDGALADTQNWYNQIVQYSQGKPILISEVGWPASGPVQGNAVPSSANANTFLQQFVCWATAQNLNYFYFSAFDALWQPEDDQKYWGLYSSDMTLKSGISLDFTSCSGVTGSPTTSAPLTQPPTTQAPAGSTTGSPATSAPSTGSPATQPPTSQPTDSVTSAPTGTNSPTGSPTSAPTGTNSVTSAPTNSVTQTSSPTFAPTGTNAPTSSPTVGVTAAPGSQNGAAKVVSSLAAIVVAVAVVLLS